MSKLTYMEREKRGRKKKQRGKKEKCYRTEQDWKAQSAGNCYNCKENHQ